MRYLLNKISKQTLFFISLIGIVVVSLVMVTTFAYQTLQVEYTSDSKKGLTVNAGVLDVSFKVTNRINDNNIPFLDDYKTASYSEFTIDNTKSSEDASYRVKLVDLEYSEVLKSNDFRYTFVKVNDNGLEIISEGDFSDLVENEYIISNFRNITKSSIEKVRLYLWIKSNSQDQSSLKNASFKGIIQIESMFSSEVPLPTLGETILASAKKGGENRTTLGTTVTEFTSISGENDRLLNNAPDDYGTSYYYYGAVIDNYVSFANKLWRIVRINGDGSIRLVLDDVAKDTSGSVITTKFNSSYNDNAYVGYMYGTSGSTTYDDTHKNINDSTIKTKVDAWYKTNIIDTNNSDYVVDTLFCNDKTLASDGIGAETKQLGYGTNITYYASTERLQYNTGTTNITISKPTFKCAEDVTNDYSRFTVNVTTLPNGNKTNGSLTYPVGLLTADEVAYAGAYKYGQTNKTYYLYNSNISSYWWLLSPYSFNSSDVYGWRIFYSYGYLYNSNVFNSSAFRPSLNLKNNVEVSSGDGTKENPYSVKLK